MQRLPEDKEEYLAPAKKQTQQISKTQTVKYIPVNDIGYTYGGNPAEPCPTCSIDNPDCLARKVTLDSERGILEKYYVKGDVNGNLFDPWSLIGDKENNTFDRLTGKLIWDFKEVSVRTFEFYKTFLQTRNQLWKRHAEKEVNNA